MLPKRGRADLHPASVLASSAALISASALLVACGGNVVYIDDGSGGAGAAGATSTVVTVPSTDSSTTATTSVGVGGGGPGLVEEVVGVGVTDGPFQVQVTPTTIGLHAVAVAASHISDVTFTHLTAPSGSVVAQGVLPNNGWEWSWFGTVGMLTPQLDHPETFPVLAPGTWTFGFHSPSPTDVSVWRRSTIDGTFHGGVLDVNFFVAGEVVDQDYAIETAAKAYSGWGGIELGDVRFFAISDAYITVDDENLFDLLKETAVAQNRPAINVIAVGEIAGSLDGAAGFATGIPGAPLDHGSEMSAVVWMVNYDAFFDPIILRHEGGHFGGLFHTSEFQAGLGDPLADTPLCDDANALGPMCPDYDYTMFPTGGSGSSLFSAQESRVLQASALYRGVFAPGEAPMVPYGPALDDGAGARGGSSFGASPERASRAVVAAKRARARLPRSHTPGAWSSALSPVTTHMLEGVGCPLGPSAGYFGELENAGAIDADVMLAIARDAAAPAYVRRRAAAHAAHLAGASLADRAAVGAALRDLAGDGGAPWVVRSGALRGVADFDPALGRALAGALANDADANVRRAADAVATRR